MTKHTCENGHCENYEIVLFSGDFDWNFANNVDEFFLSLKLKNVTN
jgi:hypothetical protein